ncbi:hypothetical protein BDV96DRAFT_597705 [Lophiotrema nucula]|uniref:Uncharacterized protein n=1 Tax=Lophiotrema nucula TaxID=690887 RepID=A0A6A5ZF52_9PLEO|nr:hypothetical protein BDV96DRAFT_597705 [Lophiotrema nucula]
MSNGTVSTSSLFVASTSAPEASSSAVSSSDPPSSSDSPSSSLSLTEPSSTAVPPTSADPSSTPVTLPSSTPDQSSQAPPSSEAPPPSSQAPPTSVVTASPQAPETQVITSFITPSASVSGQIPSVIVITKTSVINNSNPSQATRVSSAAASSTTSAPASLQNPEKQKDGNGLTTGGKTAIAVVVPVVVVALLVLAGILLWRRRKQKKAGEEERRKEVEEYGFNPNNDPTLPAVGMTSEMAEDESGYRGWGNTTNSSNRKASTTLTSGMAYSDSTSNPGGYQSPGSPTQGTHSDAHSNDPLVAGRRETLDSDGIAALGTAPNAGQNNAGVHRGPSNASSSYSAANRSDNSGDYPIPVNNPQEFYDNNGYYQPGPYGNEQYGGGSQQPVIRDVSARRNTRIESPSVFPQQGNSGISQNF